MAATSIFLNPPTNLSGSLIAGIGVDAQDTGQINKKWKCVTSGGGRWGTLSCDIGGGVGSINPSDVIWSWGSTMIEMVYTTATTDETQALFIYTGSPCDDCNFISQDKWIEPVGDHFSIANNEIDMMQNDATRDRMHMFGLQCNQQPGNAAFGHWQIDNQQGQWWTTAITDSCPLPTGTYTHIAYEGHWDLNDTTGCGAATYNNNGNNLGYGCEYFDALTINGKKHSLNVVMNSYTEPGWAAFCGNQDQIDLTNIVTSGTNPTVGGRNVRSNNITCLFGAS